MTTTAVQPKLVEWFDDHFYKFEFEEGRIEYFPSVTTKLGIINKPFLAKWRGDIGNEAADRRMVEAQDKGSREHHAWSVLCLGGAVIFQPEKKPIYSQSEIEDLMIEHNGNVAILRNQEEMLDLTKLSRWLDVVKPKILASEVLVYDIENRDAGTVDNIFEIKPGEYQVNGSKPVKLGGIYVADLKSGKSVDKSAYKQTAAYVNCVEKMGLHKDIAGTIILHTSSANRSGIEGLSTIVRTAEQVKGDYKSYRLAAALWEDENTDYSPKVFQLPTILTYKKD